MARLNAPDTLVLRPPTIARTAPSALITTTAACAFDPWRTLLSKIHFRPSSAAFCIRWSSVVRMITSSVVLRVKNSGPVDITQSAKYPPARASAASERVAGLFIALARRSSVRYPCSFIRRSTVAARLRERSRLEVGESVLGAVSRPAIIAASAGSTSAADLPKNRCAAASAP